MGTKFFFFFLSFLKSFFNSVFLLSRMVILLWHETILSQFKVFPFMASPNLWLPSSTLVSATSKPFFRNRISFSSFGTASFVYLTNSSFSLSSFICFTTFLLLFQKCFIYFFFAFSHDLSSSSVILIFQCLLSQLKVFNMPRHYYGFMFGGIFANAQ